MVAGTTKAAEAPARRSSGSSRSFVRLVESEASDAIADHDNSDHEQKHDHDRHIVLHQPLPQSLEWPAHSRRCHEVGDNRYRNGRSGDRCEQYDDNCGLTAAEPGPSDDETSRESKQQVLRNHRRQQQADPLALPGIIESTSAIHFGNSARSSLACRPRHCLSANTTRSTPTTILITAAAGDDPPESCVGNRPASNAKSATAPPTPTTHPTSRPTVLLFAFGDNNMSTVVMIVVMLIAIATARGSSSPLAVTMRISYSPMISEPARCHRAFAPWPAEATAHGHLCLLVTSP